MLLGTHTLNLDTKGRMAIPAKHRDALASADQTRVVLTINPRDTCLWLYPEHTWLPIAQQVAALPPLKPENRTLQRLLLGSACVLEPDGQGRIAITSELRTRAGLSKKIALVGLVNKFEVWDADIWSDLQAQNIAAAQQPDSEVSTELSTLAL
jgi:MraZ protein